jgi:hypothetical protein
VLIDALAHERGFLVTFLHWFSGKEPRHRSRFLTFGIKNLLIPHPIGGNTTRSVGKGLWGGYRRGEREGLSGKRRKGFPA